MEEDNVTHLFEKTAAARDSLVSDIRDAWTKTDLKLTQVHTRTGIGYSKLRRFLVFHRSSTTFSNQELVAIHTALS